MLTFIIISTYPKCEIAEENYFPTGNLGFPKMEKKRNLR
jgi:hypothetical protein